MITDEFIIQNPLLDDLFEDSDNLKYYKIRPIKYKIYKYKDRFKNRACPICGSNHFEYGFGHAEYPEVWNWQSCYNCGCVVGYEDNSPWFDIWDEIKKAKIRSKKKVLEFVRKFYLPNKKIEKIYR